MSLARFSDEVLAVIVLYKTRPEQSLTYRRLRENSNCPQIFLYDNSPEKTAPPRSEAIYHHDPSNGGVGKAYNEGLKHARSQNKRWLLLLDQDTDFPDEALQFYLSATQQFQSSQVFAPVLMDRKGIVSPFRWQHGRGKRIKAKSEKFDLARFRFANSGVLIAIDAFEQAGGYDERIHLDFSDIVFGERMRKVTDHFIATGLSMRHGFSNSENLRSDQALSRFTSFCQDAIKAGRIFGNYDLLRIRTLIRAVGLTMRYRRITFIKTFLNSARSC